MVNVKINKKLKSNEDLGQIIEHLVAKLGLQNEAEVYAFFNPPHPTSVSLVDFGFAPDYLQKLFAALERARNAYEAVVVYSDYDADGITGCAVMWETLHALGFKAHPYIGSRTQDGYGYTESGLQAIKLKFNPKVIITVDHGITAQKTVDIANTMGIKSVITDHHTRQEDLVPHNAAAIFHVPLLAGAGVAYYVAYAIFNYFKPGLTAAKANELTAKFTHDFAAIATIGTIADLVPLTKFSRSLVYHGLKSLSTSTKPGIAELKNVAAIEGNVGTYEVGYQMAPRINASGRLDDALDALRLLCTTNPTRAAELAQKLNTLNTTRQNMLKTATDKAIAMADSTLAQNPSLRSLVLYNETWHEGIIGLIASRITEKYHRPTFIFTNTTTKAGEQPQIKASARSIEGVDLTELLNELRPLVVKAGGHKGAAGVTMLASNLRKFAAELEKLLAAKDAQVFEKKLNVDMQLEMRHLTLELYGELQKFEPYGMGNPHPLFAFEGTVANIKILGKTKTHLKFIIASNGIQVDCLAFGGATKYENVKIGDQVLVAGTLDRNVWMDKESLQVKVKHIETC